MINRLFLYLNTIRHLKTKQLFYQVWYRIYSPSIPVKSYDPQVWPASWQNPTWVPDNQNPNIFEFAGHSVDLLDTQTWLGHEQSLLWQYNLHYLDSLSHCHKPKDNNLGKDILIAWIKNNPIGKPTAWDSYPISLRIVNTIKLLANHTKSIPPEICNSIGSQAAWLAKKVEYHILANHLFSNGKALLFAGCWLKNSEAIFNKGFHIVSNELDEQFLEDGAHFELSPMYHAIILWDIADIIQLANITQNTKLLGLAPKLRERLANGLLWMEKIIHPDENISFFNDACFDNGPSFKQLKCYAEQLGVIYEKDINNKKTSLGDSGYAVINLPEHKGKIIIDLAPIGAKYQPGHAHADTLSFELSLYGQRIFVNSGTSEYGASAERQLQRSTQSHNTVSINGKNSSEVWSGFRVAKRARIIESSIEESASITVIGSHDGYIKYKPSCIHKRIFQIHKQKIEITDQITGAYEKADAYFHIHPSVEVRQESKNRYNLLLKNGKKIIFHTNNSTIEKIPSQWHYSFGNSLPNTCLIIPIQNAVLETEILWEH